MGVPFHQNNTSKRTRLHQSYKTFIGEHAHEHLNISVACRYHYVYMKRTIFYSGFLQNINQNALIVACFQKFYATCKILNQQEIILDPPPLPSAKY